MYINEIIIKKKQHSSSSVGNLVFVIHSLKSKLAIILKVDLLKKSM